MSNKRSNNRRPGDASQPDSEAQSQEEQSRLDKLADAWLERRQSEVERQLGAEYSVADVLRELAAAEIQPGHLNALSDLSREDAELVRSEWPLLPVERRRAVIRFLLERAEEDLALDLSRLLRIALVDPDATVRRLAVEGLWEETDSSLIGPLVQLVHNDASDTVRAAAAAALGPFVLQGELEEMDAALTMRAEEALLAVLLRAEAALAVRCAALQSLAYSGETGIRQLIEDAYYAPEEEMRVAALSAMGRSADIRWRNMVRAELQNPSPAMRAAAAWACGELEAKTALPELLALAEDPSEEVKLSAIAALGHIGGRQARDLLAALSESEDPAEAQAADDALEEMLFYSDPEGVPLFDEDEEEEEDWADEPWERRSDDDLGEYEA